MRNVVVALPLLVLLSASGKGAETFPPLQNNVAPSNLVELWGDFDPRAEPLEVETLEEWEEDGVELRVVRFHVGVFKGEPASVAAVYGHPKGQTNLPGLLQIHGGGQYADANACIANAKRGYATVSIAWAGRISSSKYRVNPDGMQLFWDNKTDDPNYRLTTDWGAVDGYHAPSRNKGNQFPSAKAAEWTLDPIESPRNSGWFLCAVATRRALTFLENQPEVDKTRLGVYGHSMGGKLTVMTAIDPRVKAAAPSCGGISDRYNESELFRGTIGDAPYLNEVTCPIMFLSPANDFHGRINDLQIAVKELKTEDWRVTCSPHHNHQDTANYEVATLVWFDKHLKGAIDVPGTPTVKLNLSASSDPVMTVQPDESKPIVSIDVFYSRHAQTDGLKDDRNNTIARFWHHAKAIKKNGVWKADLQLSGLEKPLWAYANVTYALEEPISGAGYYYRTYTASQFNLSSLMVIQTPQQLRGANVKHSRQPTLVIEDFTGDWKKEWFTYAPDQWPLRTHKVYDDMWAAPSDDAILTIEVQSDQPNPLAIGIDGFVALANLKGGSDWQAISVSRDDFQSPDGTQLENWSGIRELRIGHSDRLRLKKESKAYGGSWKGNRPRFRNLQWRVPPAVR